MNSFDKLVASYNGHPDGLYSIDLDVIQVNIGLKCNQTCVHCHVASSPFRKEMMTWETMEHIIDAAEKTDAKMIDITGGAPEIHPLFTKFVAALKERNFKVQVRTNLTIFFEEGFEEIPEFHRDNNVRLVASLPCYQMDNVDSQRGGGVFEKSVRALRVLNELGYGSDPKLPLYLVYNPVGPHLPPVQESLEADYRRELSTKYGITFSGLWTITNMPIGRWGGDLRKKNKEKEYIKLLKDSFNPDTLKGLMCRHQINIGWDGTLYDCDFNLALKIPVRDGLPRNIDNFDAEAIKTRKIVTAQHCYGCTAGCGSSCGGSLAE